MLNTFKISYNLKNTYRANSFIYRLKQIPLIKKLLPISLYASPSLKVFANIISAIWEFLSIFFGKLIYFLLVFLAAKSLNSQTADGFVHIVIFLTIIGGFLNTRIFNPTKDKFYAISIMRMDAREYALTDYLYFLSRNFIGFLPFSLIFGLFSGAGVLTCLTVPIYMVLVKICFTAYSLKESLSTKKAKSEKSFTLILGIEIATFLVAAFLPPYLGYAINQNVFIVLTAIMIIPGALSIIYIINFNQYRWIYKELLKPDAFAMKTSKEKVTEAQRLAMHKQISIDSSQISSKTGYQYFNELFMKRHSKLLTKSAKRITIISILMFIAILVVNSIFPEDIGELNSLLLSSLPYFLFIMYVVNRGATITQALFMNCDHSMLTYRFYRQPSAILALFIERLKYIILINLIPAVAIALELTILIFITGGTDEPLNYLLTFISIIAMSVFFSVHTIVLYYLLQPYNINLESKSVLYNIANFITYIVCYFYISVQIPTLIFGTAITVFCIIYIVIAFILAYHLAPKTFKLK